jgi:hypothetical protein
MPIDGLMHKSRTVSGNYPAITKVSELIPMHQVE